MSIFQQTSTWFILLVICAVLSAVLIIVAVIVRCAEFLGFDCCLDDNYKHLDFQRKKDEEDKVIKEHERREELRAKKDCSLCVHNSETGGYCTDCYYGSHWQEDK